MRTPKSLMSLALGLATLSGVTLLRADTVTVTGNFTADNSDYATILTIPTTEVLTAYTTSYAGGVNLDGTTTMGGGFVPELTLFSGSSGNVVASSPNGMCGGMAAADSATGLCNDANLTATLTAGNYWLYLTEFPNTVDTSNQASPTFLFSSSSTATGDACGVSGGMFLEADLATCAQRTSSYALNYSMTPASGVPEPATLGLAACTLLAFGFFGRRKATTAK
jgi:hypothetical protein